MAEAIVGMDVADLRELLGAGQPAFRAKQIYQSVYRTQMNDLAQMTGLPAQLRSDLASRVAMGLPDVAGRYESADGTRRYLLRLGDGRTVETVLMPEEGRDTLCISSQVGCAVGCTFCMTALLGLERNLTAGEIVGQVLLLARENRLRQDGPARELRLDPGPGGSPQESQEDRSRGEHSEWQRHHRGTFMGPFRRRRPRIAEEYLRQEPRHVKGRQRHRN